MQLRILDDWGLEPLDAASRHDLLEILEERYGRRSTILTSQIPVDKWHALMGDPTYADAILDRLVHNAHRINLTGHSLRRSRDQPSKGLTTPATRCNKCQPARHRTPGGIMSEHRATSSRNARATSSESADGPFDP